MEYEHGEWPWEYDPEIIVPDMNLFTPGGFDSKSGEAEMWAIYHEGMARIREKKARLAREQAEREQAEAAERERPAS
jgi:hypothetical protein